MFKHKLASHREHYERKTCIDILGPHLSDQSAIIVSRLKGLHPSTPDIAPCKKDSFDLFNRTIGPSVIGRRWAPRSTSTWSPVMLCSLRTPRSFTMHSPGLKVSSERERHRRPHRMILRVWPTVWTVAIMFCCCWYDCRSAPTVYKSYIRHSNNVFIRPYNQNFWVRTCAMRNKTTLREAAHFTLSTYRVGRSLTRN